MARFKHLRNWSILFVTIVGLSGCGGSSNLPDTVDAGGTVTYNGDPVPGARVVFRVKGGRPATAITGGDGKFALSTFGEQDGAIPGEHTVTVMKTLKAGVAESSNDPSNADTMEKAVAASERQSSSGGAAVSESIIPTRYASPDTSLLNFTVSDSGDNEFAIELTD